MPNALARLAGADAGLVPAGFAQHGEGHRQQHTGDLWERAATTSSNWVPSKVGM